MDKILFITNNLQNSDGVAICLKNLVNILSDKYEIHLLNLYRYEENFINSISNAVTIHNCFKFYIKGLRSITNRFLKLLLKHKCFKLKYDFVISYQNGTPSILIDYMKKNCYQRQAVFIGFIHGFNTKQLTFYNRLDAIICISNDGKNLAQKHISNSFKGKIKHIRNIYSVDEIITKSELQPKAITKLKVQGKKVFCIVSRLSPEKGVERFVEALIQVKKIDSNIIGIIVGNGKLFNHIQKIIINNKASDFIYMVGAQSNPYPFIKISDFLCCTSFSEGLCTSCVEASILKKIILSTNVCGAHEIVYNPDIGLVVDNNLESIYKGMLTLLSMRFENLNFENARKKWDSSNTQQQYISLLESLKRQRG